MTPPRGHAEAAGSPARRAGSWASRPLTFGCLLLGGLGAVVASAQPWWRASGTDALVTFSGTEATGGLSQALALVTLAGILLVLVLKVRGRRVVAVLLAATGLGQAVLGLLRQQPAGEAVRTRIREVSLVEQYTLTPTLWPWLAAGAGALVVLGAIALLVGCPSWTTARSRFDRQAPGADDAVAADDPVGLWKALDAGLDPTDVEREDRPGRTDPDVHNGAAGDTMVANTDRQQPDRLGSHRMESDGVEPADRSAQPPE